MRGEKEKLYTVNRLALLAKMDRGALERRLHAVPPAERKGNARLFHLCDVLPLMVQVEENAALANQILKDRSREMSANADLREHELGLKNKTLCHTADALLFVNDCMIRMRQRYEKTMKGFSARQQAELFKVFNDSIADICTRKPLLYGEEPLTGIV